MAENQIEISEEKRFLLECIRLYRDLPTLWNVKSKVYYDRARKDMAYKILLRKYREWFPKATRDDLKRKFNALRTNYRKELKKHIESVKSVSEPVYEPSLWYYKELTFLDRITTSDPKCSTDVATIKFEVGDDENTENSAETLATSQDQHLTERDMAFRTVKKTYVDENVHANEIVMNNLEYKNVSDNKDEYYHWAMACAGDIQKMERTQQIFAKKAIAEILMEGQLGLLNRHSVKVNESQVYNEYSQSSIGQISSTPSPSQVSYNMEHESQNLELKPLLRNPLEDDDNPID